MKLYTASFSPSPRRVHIYLDEKGLDIERVFLDMMKGEHRAPAFREEKNPLGKLPVLELDDGRVLTESMAICEYLEELYPEPPLIGADPWQRARTREASRIAELGCMVGAGQAFQHSSPFFANRFKQSPDTAEGGRKLFGAFLRRIDGLLAERPWLAGDMFTVADITAICAVDFGKFAGCPIDPALEHVARWLGEIRTRPSCQLKKS